MDPKADHQTGTGLSVIYLTIDEVEFRGSSLQQDEKGFMREGLPEIRKIRNQRSLVAGWWWCRGWRAWRHQLWGGMKRNRLISSQKTKIASRQKHLDRGLKVNYHDVLSETI